MTDTLPQADGDDGSRPNMNSLEQDEAIRDLDERVRNLESIATQLLRTASLRNPADD